MSDIFGRNAAGGGMDAEAKKQAVMRQVKNELALANAQQLLNSAGEKCFAKCVTKPSTSLSSSEETCLSRCLDRYMEAFNTISRTYMNRVSREGQSGDEYKSL